MVTAPEYVLRAIADPNVALLLVVLGMFGIYAEFCLPGRLVPGVTGAILLLLGFTAFAHLPIARAGVSLILLGLAFCILEARWPARGILSALGAAILIEGAHSALHARWGVAIALAIPFALVTSFLLSIAIRARRNKMICV